MVDRRSWPNLKSIEKNQPKNRRQSWLRSNWLNRYHEGPRYHPSLWSYVLKYMFKESPSTFLWTSHIKELWQRPLCLWNWITSSELLLPSLIRSKDFFSILPYLVQAQLGQHYSRTQVTFYLWKNCLIMLFFSFNQNI